MFFDEQQNQFDSLGQWFAWRVGLDLAEFCEAVPPELAAAQAELRRGETALHRFFQDLLSDLYKHPKAYGVPEIPYEITLPGDQAREDRLREGRLKVRRVIETGLLDYLYQLGRLGQLDGAAKGPAANGPAAKGPAAEAPALQFSRFFYDQLVAEKKKKVKTITFLQPLEGLGLATTIDKERVVVSNQRYPGMMAALGAFSRECARIKDLDFFFFRRCDFAVFTQKRLPAFEDALRLAPGALRSEILKMDMLLCERKFKREILVANADGGYRFRYSKKSDAIVYWCRIRSWSSQDLSHSLRWDFAGLSPALFARLDACKPRLAEQVFAGIKTCTHCYGNCMARVNVEYQSTIKEGCKEAGWEAIGESPASFENLRTVVCLLDDLVSDQRA